MAPPLTIRNLTPTPIELKYFERFEASAPSGAGGSDNKNFLGNVTKMLGNSSSPAKGGLVIRDGTQSFSRQDANIRIDPFQTARTEIQPTERGPNEVLRLNFEIDGQAYSIDTPSSSNQSTQLAGLSPDARQQLTGVTVPNETFLAIYSSNDLQAWMRAQRDETPLSALSIPGTHNSPTCNRALPSVRCQAVSPRAQLDNGVRFFDIRLQVDGPDKLQLVHGVFPISLTGSKMFRELVDTVLSFLNDNPSETVIISAKREGTGSATDDDLARALRDNYVNRDRERWWVDPNIPSLGAARGKIALMRRFMLPDEMRGEHDGRGWGLDAESWEDNTPTFQRGYINVQDFYQVLETENIDRKTEYARAQCGRAAEIDQPIPGVNTDREHPLPPASFFLNFLSASNFWKTDCWPEKIAAKLNPALVAYLCKDHNQDGRGDGCTGIVILDWVGDNGDWDIVRCIVGMNAKLLNKR